VVADILSLKTGGATLSVFTNELGGIIDDTVIQRQDDHIYVVCNAGCAEKDLRHLSTRLQRFNKEGGEAELEVIGGLGGDRSLIALQGNLFKYCFNVL